MAKLSDKNRKLVRTEMSRQWPRVLIHPTEITSLAAAPDTIVFGRSARRHGPRRSPPARPITTSPEPAAAPPLPLRRLAPWLHRPHRHRHCLHLRRRSGGRGRGARPVASTATANACP
jgi:hypothetical protein